MWDKGGWVPFSKQWVFSCPQPSPYGKVAHSAQEGFPVKPKPACARHGVPTYFARGGRGVELSQCQLGWMGCWLWILLKMGGAFGFTTFMYACMMYVCRHVCIYVGRQEGR